MKEIEQDGEVEGLLEFMECKNWYRNVQSTPSDLRTQHILHQNTNDLRRSEQDILKCTWK